MQGAEDILTPEGVMEVRLLEATNVPKMDMFGQGDPFVKCAHLAVSWPCGTALPSLGAHRLQPHYQSHG